MKLQQSDVLAEEEGSAMPLEGDAATWQYMPWIPQYVMNNKRLTTEHYRLVYLTNYIQYLLDTGCDNDARLLFVDDIAPLARRHLRYEILVMVAINYEGINKESYEKHCLSHKNLVDGIEEICASISNKDMTEVSAFLKNWLDNHIKTEDADYNAEIVKLGIRNG